MGSVLVAGPIGVLAARESPSNPIVRTKEWLLVPAISPNC
ncbi:Uncharacterised protein [Mycobacteroides abscessus subsp. abscessus]|nr:Uncharacterised protein [Mycobacteroides abscessus subsp. abscessus]SHV33024.1 Uncharacterised protein [Mycobacteroides abscessus subsp. abscessus]SIH78427.1 Uncharacterised protein [Mycobacteroides abscessus subsp. abscessus]SII98222.1 Uncharacterised protein [Mycobacteroides abscessus subsp. abscessus]SKQ00938.1 Uncharacterised protein [Mycobacteroides abscessus subsp. abscessus]